MLRQPAAFIEIMRGGFLFASETWERPKEPKRENAKV